VGISPSFIKAAAFHPLGRVYALSLCMRVRACARRWHLQDIKIDCTSVELASRVSVLRATLSNSGAGRGDGEQKRRGVALPVLPVVSLVQVTRGSTGSAKGESCGMPRGGEITTGLGGALRRHGQQRHTGGPFPAKRPSYGRLEGHLEQGDSCDDSFLCLSNFSFSLHFLAEIIIIMISFKLDGVSF